MATKSMIARFQRVQASARQKKIAELEKSAAEEIRLAKKKAVLKNKSESTDKDDGKGPTAKTTAKDKSKLPAPKPKGNKADAKLDVKGPAGEPKKSPKETKQKALDKATAKRKEITSETPPLAATPKPKLSSTTDRKAWRKAKLAELKIALNTPNPAVLDEMGEEVAEMPNTQGKASKQQRVPAFQILQRAQKLIPMMTQQLTQANDMLEDAVMSSDLQKIKGALTFLLTKVQEITKGEIVPLGATIRKLMGGLSPKQASSTKFAPVTKSAHALGKLDSEFARSKLLMRMASNKITL